MTKTENISYIIDRGLRIFPLHANSKKPLGYDWPNTASIDPDLATAIWVNNDDSVKKNNIGVLTGTQNEEGKFLVVVDIDIKETKNGYETLVPFSLSGRDLEKTFTVKTPSGGEHYYYYSNVLYNNGANVLGPGVDIRGHHGYVVAPGSSTNGSEYEITDESDIAPLPEWLYKELASKEYEASSASPLTDNFHVDEATERALVQSAMGILQRMEPAVQGEGGDEKTYKLFARLKDLGLTLKQSIECVAESGWNETCQPPWSKRELYSKAHNAFMYGKSSRGSEFETSIHALSALSFSYEPEETDSLIADFNSRFFVGVQGSNLFICETDINGDITNRWPIRIFHQLYANCTLSVIDGGKPLQATEIWFKHSERKTKTLYFDGARDYTKDSDVLYNEFRGFPTDGESHDEADVSARDALKSLQEHVFENVCRGDEEYNKFFWAWMAHIIQKPGVPSGIAPVLMSHERGTGKSIFIDIFMNLLGPYTGDNTIEVFKSRFNDFFYRKFLFCVDEAYRLSSKEAQSKIRHLITANSLAIEGKGEKVFDAKNNLNFLFTTNYLDVFDVTPTERRLVFLEVKPTWRYKPEKFESLLPFSTRDSIPNNRLLFGELSDSKHLDYNMHDIFKYQASAENSSTSSVFLDSLEASLTEVQQFLIRMFSDGELTKWCDVHEHKGYSYGTLDNLSLFDIYKQELRAKNVDTKGQTLGSFTREMKTWLGLNSEGIRFNTEQGRRRLSSKRMKSKNLTYTIEDWLLIIKDQLERHTMISLPDLKEIEDSSQANPNVIVNLFN